jgi:hypothetical protein
MTTAAQRQLEAHIREAAARGGTGRMRLPRISEAAIQTVVMRHIALRAKPGVVAFHPANGGLRGLAEAARFKAQGVLKGVPDIIIIANGRVYGLELKADGGKLSAAQIEVHARLRDAGAIVESAWSIDDALAKLTAWGVITK